MKLTKKFIKENAVMTLKEAFPEVFETVLEVGKWYKYINSDTLVFTEDIEQKKGYGFYDGEFEKSSNKWAFYLTDKWIPATPQEIQDALEKEAVRRGFKEGITVTPPCEKWCRNLKIHNNIFLTIRNEFLLGGICIFKNGTWATIIPTITKQEAEERLGMKII